MERRVNAERDHDRPFRSFDSTRNTALDDVQKRYDMGLARVAEMDCAMSADDGFAKDVKVDHQKLFKKKDGSVIASAFGFQDLPRFKTDKEGDKKIDEEEGDRESVWDFEEEEVDDDDRSAMTAAKEWKEFSSYNGPSMFRNLRKKKTILRPLRDPNAPKSRFAVSEVDEAPEKNDQVVEEPQKKLDEAVEKPKSEIHEAVEAWVEEEDWFKEESIPAAATETRSVTLSDALPKNTPAPMNERPVVSPVAQRPALSPKPVAFGNASFTRTSPSSSKTGLVGQARSAVPSGSTTLPVKPRDGVQYVAPPRKPVQYTQPRQVIQQLHGAIHSSSAHSGNSSFGSFRPVSASTWTVNNSSAASEDRLEKNQGIRMVLKESDCRDAIGNEENKKDFGAVSVLHEFITNLDLAMNEILLTRKVTAEARRDMEDVHNAVQTIKKVTGAVYRLCADDETMTYLKAQHPGIHAEAKKFMENK